MYKIFSIAALTAGMLLLAPGAHAVPMTFDVVHHVPASNSATRGLLIAHTVKHGLQFHQAASHGHQNRVYRASRHASFNRILLVSAGTRAHPGLATKMPVSTVTAVPEPGMLGLLAAAFVAGAVVRVHGTQRRARFLS